MSGDEKKIVIMGDGGVGKSCLVNVFVGNAFPDDYDATIFDKYRACITVDGKSINVELHDTAGQDEFTALWDDWIREADAIVLLYSVVDQKTFEVITQNLYPLILRTREADAESLPIALCGNKCDLPADQHEVDAKAVEDYAKENGWGWVEASAKSNINVKVPFEHVARELLAPKVDTLPVKKKGSCSLL